MDDWIQALRVRPTFCEEAVFDLVGTMHFSGCDVAEHNEYAVLGVLFVLPALIVHLAV